MFSRLEVSEKPVRDKDNHFTKPRALNEVRADVWKFLLELCDGQHPWPLFLHGPSGSGKSCAALCLVDRIPGAKFWPMPAMDHQVREIKAGTAIWYKVGVGGPWTMKNWWNSIASLPLLVLDDVGIPEVHSETKAETLFMALEAREGKPLICTSNLNDKDIETTYSSRIQSRMCSGSVRSLIGPDRRYEQKAAAPVTVPKK